MVVVVARDDDCAFFAQQRQAIMGIADRMVMVKGDTEAGDIAQADQPVMAELFDPADHFPGAFYWQSPTMQKAW